MRNFKITQVIEKTIETFVRAENADSALVTMRIRNAGNELTVKVDNVSESVNTIVEEYKGDFK